MFLKLQPKSSTTSAATAGAIGTLLSIANVVVGFGFQAILAAALGVDALADVFQVGWTIVTFAAVVQFTMVTSLLVPGLQAIVNDSDAVGRSLLPVGLGVAACTFQALGAILLADGDLTVLLVATAPSHLFVGATAVPQAIAYIYRRFWIAGVGPVVNGIALLSVTLVGLSDLNALVLGAAVTAGYGAQWAVTAIGVRDLKALACRSIALRTKLFLGVLGFTLISKFQPVLERVVSYQLATGSTAALGYGQKVAQGLVLFAMFGMATASAASLARHRQARSFTEAADLLARITLSTFTFGCVVVAIALPAAQPTVVVLFERGAFSAADSVFVANIVIAQLPWVLAAALTGVLTAYLYVDRRYSQVLLASLAGLVVTLLCGLSLSALWPEIAVAVASSAGASASLVVVVAIVRHTEVWQDYRRLLLKRWRLLLASSGVLVVSISIYGALRLGVQAPGLVEYTLATAVTGVSAAVLLLSSKAARAALRESLSAKL